jgi:large subunit ribosomal protein L19
MSFLGNNTPIRYTNKGFLLFWHDLYNCRYMVAGKVFMKANKLTRETIRDIGVFDRDFDVFNIGDTVAVSQRIKEGEKERLQVFEGDVIAMHKKGISTTFTVRKIGANSIAVERVFPYYSPKIALVKRVRYGKVRRAKLYYMRDRIGKAARVKELVLTREQKEKMAERNKKAKAI